MYESVFLSCLSVSQPASLRACWNTCACHTIYVTNKNEMFMFSLSCYKPNEANCSVIYECMDVYVCVLHVFRRSMCMYVYMGI